MGDPRRIRQVITNLLSNALRFTDEGHIICVVALMANNGWSKWKTAAAVLIPRNWLKSSSHLFRLAANAAAPGWG
ncbi:hypothetical protein ACNKHM_01360 [Shigella sonnei]